MAFMWVCDCISVMRYVIRASHELRGSESKKGNARRAEQSYKRELKANEPVSERSERASG